MTAATVTRSRLLQYGLLAMPVAFAGFPLYVLAPDYYATRFGLSLSLLGLILLGLRMFDAVLDPFIGVMSDRFHASSRWFMPLAAIILCASLYGLFNHIPVNAALWFALCMGVAVIAYSVLSINLNAYGALWTKDESAQTRIAAFREAFALVGLVVAVSAPGIFTQYMGKEQAYLGFSLLLTVLMVIGIIAFRRWQSAQALVTVNPLHTPSGLRQAISSMRPETKQLLAVYALSMVASSMPAVLVLFYVRDLLDAEHYTGLFLLLYFCSGIVGMPLWSVLSLRYGKHRAWLASMLLAVVSFAGAFFLQAGDTWQYGLICILSGLALGADLTLPPSMLADQLHRSGLERQASTHYSFLALIAKASLALATVTVLPLLDLAGFVPATVNGPFALMMLSLCYAVLPCFLKCCAGLMLYLNFIYPTQGVHHENHQFNSTYRSSHHV